MVVNDIEYVKRNLLLLLPDLLNFDSVIDKLIENYQSKSLAQTKVTLDRLIFTTENEMDAAISCIFEHVVECFSESLAIKISNYYRGEKQEVNVR